MGPRVFCPSQALKLFEINKNKNKKTTVCKGSSWASILVTTIMAAIDSMVIKVFKQTLNFQKTCVLISLWHFFYACITLHHERWAPPNVGIILVFYSLLPNQGVGINQCDNIFWACNVPIAIMFIGRATIFLPLDRLSIVFYFGVFPSLRWWGLPKSENRSGQGGLIPHSLKIPC